MYKKVYNNTYKGNTIMNTSRLNITIPTSMNDEINKFAEELNEKKSHIIASALDMYFDYLDIKLAEKRLNDPDESISSFDEVKKELGI